MTGAPARTRKKPKRYSDGSSNTSIASKHQNEDNPDDGPSKKRKKIANNEKEMVCNTISFSILENSFSFTYFCFSLNAMNVTRCMKVVVRWLSTRK